MLSLQQHVIRRCLDVQQRLCDVFDQVFGCFDADGQAHQCIGDIAFESVLEIDLDVRHTGGVFGQRFIPPETHGHGDELQMIEKAE